MTSCPRCGEPWHEGEPACPHCGTRTHACPTCGGGVADGDRFCGHCGSSQDGATITPGMIEPESSPWDEVLERLRKATLGEFQIKRELGRGGMAAVYLAHDIALNRKVAIKVMSPGLLMGPGMVERFKQEAITVANLNHPHIITIHAVRQMAGLHFFVMKLIAGRSLELVVKDGGRLPVPVVQAILYQVGSALAYGHRRGVIHRDVKPGNILMDEDGNAIVTDFGIAKVRES
ncbi:MAG TPA: serine/threonine-protein kinase, partial [Gemmatimonadales bacterium]|nr:serine/threonine-protein kinase [Gemmatimonadales bacterium]